MRRARNNSNVGQGFDGSGSSSVTIVRVVAFIASPLQAVNLREYCRRFGRTVDLVVVEGVAELDPSSITQIEGVVSRLEAKQVIFCDSGLSAKRIHQANRDLVVGLDAICKHLPTAPYECVVGEYHSPFTWAVLKRLGTVPRDIVVVDDGTATLLVDRRRLIPRSRHLWRQNLKRLAFLSVGIFTFPPRGLTFFTTYAVEKNLAGNDTLICNDYRNLRAELQRLPPDDHFAYVIGSAHLEDGVVEGGDVELALDLIRFAAEYTGRKVVYMAHRRERPEKLDALQVAATVVTPDVPFEIYPEVIGKRPLTVVGYNSSALVTVAKFLGNSTEVISLQIPRDVINESWIPLVEAVYEYYRRELPQSIRIVEDRKRFLGRDDLSCNG